MTCRDRWLAVWLPPPVKPGTVVICPRCGERTRVTGRTITDTRGVTHYVRHDE